MFSCRLIVLGGIVFFPMFSIGNLKLVIFMIVSVLIVLIFLVTTIFSLYLGIDS